MLEVLAVRLSIRSYLSMKRRGQLPLPAGMASVVTDTAPGHHAAHSASYLTRLLHLKVAL